MRWSYFYRYYIKILFKHKVYARDIKIMCFQVVRGMCIPPVSPVCKKERKLLPKKKKSIVHCNNHLLCSHILKSDDNLGYLLFRTWGTTQTTWIEMGLNVSSFKKVFKISDFAIITTVFIAVILAFKTRTKESGGFLLPFTLLYGCLISFLSKNADLSSVWSVQVNLDVKKQQEAQQGVHY